MFDIKFTRFATNIFVPFLWIVALVSHFLDYGYTTLTIFGIIEPIELLEFLLFSSISLFIGLLAIVNPVVAFLLNTIILFLSLILTRIVLELIIVLFRIETNTRANRSKE